MSTRYASVLTARGSPSAEVQIKCRAQLSQYRVLTTKNNDKMKKYRCTVCGWVYDPAIGDADSGIAPNTPFEEIPDEWVCPLCGVGKEDFEPVEE